MMQVFVNAYMECIEGNFAEYGKDKERRLGKDVSQPQRMKYKN